MPREASRDQGHRAARAFVGRERELGELTAALDDVERGRGSIFLVTGEPGIGKSRLAAELASRATLRGARVLWGRAWEGGKVPAYWPWIEAIRAYARAAEPGQLEAQLGAGGALVASMVPEIRERIPSLAPAPGFTHAQEEFRFSLFDATSTFLRRAAEDRPLVIVLEDLHAADRPSLLLLQFVAREVSAAKLLLVTTCREHEARQVPGAAAILAEVARHGHRIPMGGLDEADVGGLVESALGARPTAGLIRSLRRTTEGNPLFVDEIVRLLLADANFRSARRFLPNRFNVPESVRDVIRRRLAPLADESRRALSIASAVGREFDLGLVERVCGLERERLLDLLGEAEASGIVAAMPERPGGYRFLHELFRTALYEDLASSRRLGLHRQIGDVLEQEGEVAGEERLAALAHHFTRAAESGEAVAKAVSYAARAGERAVAVLGFEDAAEHFQDALRALAFAPVRDDSRACELLLRLGDALWPTGEFDRAKETFRQAAEIAARLADGERLARAALGYGGFFSAFEGGIVDPILVDLLERSLAALGREDGILRARVSARLAHALTPANVRERTAALSCDALAMARRLGDEATLADVLNRVLCGTWGPDNLDERFETSAELVRLATAVGDPRLLVQAHGWRISIALEAADVAGAAREIGALERHVTAVRQPFGRWIAATNRAMWGLFEGRFGEVEALANDALLTAPEGQSDATQAHGGHILFLRREQDRAAELVDATQAFTARYPEIPAWRCALALLFADLGRDVDAQRELDILAADDFGHILRGMVWLGCVHALAEVASFLGDARRAATLYPLLLPFADRSAIVPVTFCFGSVSRSLGLLATTLSRFDEAERHFLRALDANRAMRTRPWVAWTQLDHARMLVLRGGTGDRERARRLVTEALAAARDTGMTRLARLAAALAAETDAPGGPLRGEPDGNVFRREGDFWTLAYRGTTIRLKDSKGLRDISHLLSTPRREVHVADLVVAAEGAPSPVSPGVGHDLERLGLSTAGSGADATLDAHARAEYRRRLDELRSELDEAERANDVGRKERAREEFDDIAAELAAALGLGGRARKSGHPAERARKAVTERIRYSLTRIEKAHPPLGRHLRKSLRTGTFCAYDPEQPEAWAV